MSKSLICSFSLSDLSESLMVAQLSWATWSICSRLLISSEHPERLLIRIERSERIDHSRSFDLSEMIKWVNSHPWFFYSIYTLFLVQTSVAKEGWSCSVCPGLKPIADCINEMYALLRLFSSKVRSSPKRCIVIRLGFFRQLFYSAQTKNTNDILFFLQYYIPTFKFFWIPLVSNRNGRRLYCSFVSISIVLPLTTYYIKSAECWGNYSLPLTIVSTSLWLHVATAHNKILSVKLSKLLRVGCC